MQHIQTYFGKKKKMKNNIFEILSVIHCSRINSIKFLKLENIEFCLSYIVQFFSIGGDLIYVVHLCE